MDDVTRMDVVEGRDDLLDDCGYYSLIVYTATETSIGNIRHEMRGEIGGKGIRRLGYGGNWRVECESLIKGGREKEREGGRERGREEGREGGRERRAGRGK